MTDIKEAQGLEVVAWQDAENQLYTTGEKRQMHGWATDGYPIVELVRLSDATAVIDQLKADNKIYMEYNEALKAEVERLKDDIECYKKLHAWLQAQLAAQTVVLPPCPYMPESDPAQMTDYEIGEAQGRCDMWEEVSRLNKGAKPMKSTVVYEDTEEDIEQSEYAMRKKFEEWHKARYPAVKIRQKNLLGTYSDAQVECNFETWLACIEFMGLNKGGKP